MKNQQRNQYQQGNRGIWVRRDNNQNIRGNQRPRGRGPPHQVSCLYRNKYNTY